MSNSNISVSVFPVRNPEASRVKAMAQVTVKGIKISGCKILEGSKGLFLGFPTEKGHGDKAGEYFPLVTLEREDHVEANRIALATFHALATA